MRCQARLVPCCSSLPPQYERGHRQAQAAWPTLGDDPFAGKGGKGKHVKTKSECGKKSHGSGGSGSGGGGSYRPAGGIRVIRKASGLRNDSQESQAAASGGSASKPRIKVTRTLHSRVGGGPGVSKGVGFVVTI